MKNWTVSYFYGNETRYETIQARSREHAAQIMRGYGVEIYDCRPA